MNAPEPRPEIRRTGREANQRLLVAEFARLKRLLRGEAAEDAGEQVERCRAALPAPAAIDRLAERFGLSAFERDLLLLRAGVEMDAELARAAAPRRRAAPSGLGRASPSPLPPCPKPIGARSRPVRPLRRWRLLEPADDTALVAGAAAHRRARAALPRRHQLSSTRACARLLRRIGEPAAMADAHQAARRYDRLPRSTSSAPPLPVLQLWGDDLHGKRDMAARLAGALRPAAPRPRRRRHSRQPARGRSSWPLCGSARPRCSDSALLVECADGRARRPVRRFVERVGGLTLVGAARARELCPQRPALPGGQARSPPTSCACGSRPWAARRPRLNGALDGVASEFRLSAQDIQRAAAPLARAAAVLPDPAAALWQACRAMERPRLDDLAQRIEPAAGWDDLVLPEAAEGDRCGRSPIAACATA